MPTTRPRSSSPTARADRTRPGSSRFPRWPTPATASSRGTVAASATRPSIRAFGTDAAVADLVAVLDAAGVRTRPSRRAVDGRLVGDRVRAGPSANALQLTHAVEHGRRAVDRRARASTSPTSSRPRPAPTTGSLGVHSALAPSFVTRDPAHAFLYQQLNTFHTPRSRRSRARSPGAASSTQLSTRSASRSLVITGSDDILFPAALVNDSASRLDERDDRRDRRRRPLPLLRTSRRVQRRSPATHRRNALARCERELRSALVSRTTVARVLHGEGFGAHLVDEGRGGGERARRSGPHLGVTEDHRPARVG